MSNPYVIYNGVSSEALGVIVTALPDLHRAQRSTARAEVPGSSIPVIMDEGNYDVYTTQMEINCNGVALSTVYAWLRGEGWLITSDEPDFKVYVYLHGQIDNSRFRVDGQCYDTLKVDIMAEPYRREVNEAQVVITQAADTFAGRGADNALPNLRIETSGSGGDIQLIVNGRIIDIDGLNGTMDIDSEAGVVTKGTSDPQWAGSMVTLEDGWPELLPEGQSNLISWTGPVRRVTITPKWRYL